jgi:hypothetical protein
MDKAQSIVVYWLSAEIEDNEINNLLSRAKINMNLAYFLFTKKHPRDIIAVLQG